MSEYLTVTLAITANKPTESLPPKQELDKLILRALESMVTDLASGSRLAESLALPKGLPIKVSLRIVPRNQNEPSNGHIPLRASLTGFPETLDKVRVIEEKINDLVFSHLRHIKPSEDLATALGYDSAHTSEFHLAFDEQVPQAFSPDALIQAAACAPGSAYSWGKGCNSWPW